MRNDMSEGLAALWVSLLTFVPKLIAFLLILIIGLIVAKVIAKAIEKLLEKAGFDRAVERGGVKRALARSKFDASDIVAKLVYYTLVLFVLQFAFGVFGPNPISDLIASVIAFLPGLIVAIIIVIVAAAIAAAVKTLIEGTLGGLSYGKALANIASVFILGLGIIAALEQVGVATAITTPILVAVLATVAGVIIVGVGGGLIKPMQHRWEGYLAKAEDEAPKIKAEAASAPSAETQVRAAAARAQATTTTTPSPAPPATDRPLLPSTHRSPPPNKEKHMISTDDLTRVTGSTVVDSDGDKVGTAREVYLDDSTGQPEWVTVNTGLFGTSESFVPLAQAEIGTDGLRVPYAKSVIKDAPRLGDSGHLTPEEEDELYRYYGVSGQGRTDDLHLERDRETTTTGTAGYDSDRATVGHDTSGPTTDDAMTRSEERLNVGTERREAGVARLRKFVTTEQQTVTVPVTKEEVRLVTEPVTEANLAESTDGPEITEREHEVVLHEERPVVTTETVPVERVRMETDQVTETETVSGEVRKEHIEAEGVTDRAATDRDRT